VVLVVPSPKFHVPVDPDVVEKEVTWTGTGPIGVNVKLTCPRRPAAERALTTRLTKKDLASANRLTGVSPKRSKLLKLKVVAWGRILSPRAVADKAVGRKRAGYF
jgi:hypothetical protein